MRRVASLLAVVVLLMSMCCIGVSATDTNLIANAHEELNLRNAIANVQKVNGADAVATVKSDNAPSVIYVDAGEVPDLTAFFKACVENDVLPVVYVATRADAQNAITARGDADCVDTTFVSGDASVLTFVREERSQIRTGLTYDLPSEALSSKEADTVRKAVRSAPATFCVISSEDASYHSVSELQELAVAVWVEVKAPVGTDEFKVEALRALTSGANGVISASASELSNVVNTYFEKNTMTRTPVLIGHRGNPTKAPENTISSFTAAYENGADVFEIDVEITKDGEVIIMHDDSIKRTTNYDGDKTVGEMTLAEVKEYFVLSKDGKTVTDEKVPTLREVCEIFKDKDIRIFIEFKGNKIANVAATAAIIKEYDMEDRVDVISFNTALIEETHKQMPGVSTGYLHSPSASAPQGEKALLALEMSLKTVQNAQSSINPNKGVISDDYLQAATDRGLTVWPWTYSNSSNGSIFLKAPDGITTDDAQWSLDINKYLKAIAEQTNFRAGESTTVSVAAVKYGGAETVLTADDVIIQVISGADCITVDGMNITGVKDGTATIMYGYKTAAGKAGMYVLYSQPITITVGDPPAVSPIEGMEADTFNVLLVVVIVVFIAIVAAVVTAVVIAAVMARSKD